MKTRRIKRIVQPRKASSFGHLAVWDINNVKSVHLYHSTNDFSPVLTNERKSRVCVWCDVKDQKYLLIMASLPQLMPRVPRATRAKPTVAPTMLWVADTGMRRSVAAISQTHEPNEREHQMRESVQNVPRNDSSLEKNRGHSGWQWEFSKC